MTKRFIRIRRSVGLDSVRLHDLRHFTATRMLSEGVPVRTVSGRLGHANAATTLGVYGHFLEASDRDAADTLSNFINIPAMSIGESDESAATTKPPRTAEVDPPSPMTPSSTAQDR